MDYKLVSGFLGVLCLLLAAYSFSGVAVKTVYVNNTIYPVDDLSVAYLYPLRCVNCNLNTPGACDFCNSYYDARNMDLLSQDVGVPVKFFVSDVVTKPNVILEYNGRMSLADARNKFNIAHGLCDLAGVNKSCELFDNEIQRVRLCVGKYGIGVNTVVYHRSGKDCPLCSRTDAIVDQLKNANYDENTKYKVYTVDQADPVQNKLLGECMQGFDNLDYSPQLLCPATGRELTGEFSLSQAQGFADQCMEAKI